ncbi:MAG: mannose-6-phosphate isomerase, class I, partial [Glutamicibacter sp.]
ELASINKIYPGDPGVLVALLLNLIFLEPGQAISLGAGNVHAYLRGLGIEVMANSDNVLRGGLTSKHIDVPELLDVTIAAPSPAPILEPVALDTHDRLYKPDFEEFQLQVLDPIEPGLAADLQLHGAAVLLCTAGEFLVATREGERSISRGQSLFLTAAELPATAILQGTVPGQLFAASAQIG